MRVFISHGTDEKKQAELDYLFELEQGLAALPGVDVFLDRQRLKMGDLWEDRLLDAIAGCNVALIVLSQRALKRPWVVREATLLGFRKRREPAFRLYCVRRPDVTARMLAAHPWVKTSGLQSVQAARGNPTAAQVVQAIASDGAPAPGPRTRLERLQDALEAMLEQARPQRLEALCEQILGAPAPWIGSSTEQTRCAQLLASAVLRGRFSPLGQLHALARELMAAGLPRASMRRVIELAAPMWVDEDIASRLTELIDVTEGGEPFAAALNGGFARWSTRMVAARTQLPTLADNVLYVVGGGSDNGLAELIMRIRRAYRARRDVPDDLDSDEQVDEVLRARVQPIFCVLPREAGDTQLLRALRQRFPRVTFIVSSGQTLPTASSPVLSALTPGLNVDMERRLHAEYGAIMELQ